jgi:uncharacterized protein YbjT (DUF2867 family)
MAYKVIIVGASGLIGNSLLSVLIRSEQIAEITLLLRNSISISCPKVKEIIINFDELDNYASKITGDIIYCCLGTTKSKSPDPNNYRKVDLEYPLNLAKMGLQNGVGQFHVVSSLGASSESKNGYLKLKGELESELKKLNIPSLHIYQPSFLEGKRQENRPLEKLMMPIMKLLNPILLGSLENYRSIKAFDVAKAMMNQSIKELKGVFTYPSKQIKELA